MENTGKRDSFLKGINESITKHKTRLDIIGNILKEEPRIFIRSYSEEFYILTADIDKLETLQSYLSTVETDVEAIQYLNEIRDTFIFNLSHDDPKPNASGMVCMTRLWELTSYQRIIRLINYLLL